jgi:molybdopterin adenylyltransferase
VDTEYSQKTTMTLPSFPSPSHQSHQTEAAATQPPVRVGLITVSDTRTAETDVNGQFLRQAVAEAGHEVVAYHLVPDEPAQIAALLEELTAGNTAVQLLICNGGTGLAPRDTTYDVLSGKLEKTLPGFGELFRLLSYEQIGAGAMLSRATAGVYRQTVIFATPGSPHAVRLAWEKLIAPELTHLVWTVAGQPASKSA